MHEKWTRWTESEVYLRKLICDLTSEDQTFESITQPAAASICAATAQTVLFRPNRATAPSLVKNYDAAVEITALQPQQAAAISRSRDYKKQ